MTSSSGDENEGGGTVGESEQFDGGANDAVPRPKRIACILCRKRKLKCDSNKPSCGTCSRLNHRCEYSEERKKSGPKRGYVKLLEARLKQVENLLETRDAPAESTSTARAPQPQTASETFAPMPPLAMADAADTSMSGTLPEENFTDPTLVGMSDFTLNANDDFSWEMIGLGLEEALPSREVIDELYD